MNGYQIVHDKRYDAELEVLFGNLKRADELIRAIEAVLLTRPQDGHHIIDRIWFLEDTDGCCGGVRIFYTFTTGTAPTARKVLLLSIVRI